MFASSCKRGIKLAADIIDSAPIFETVWHR